MAEKGGKHERFDKYILVALVVAIIAAVGVYAYTHLVEKESEASDADQTPVVEPEKTLLTITISSESFNYSLDELIALDSIAGYGSYVNKIGKITGPNSYTGVSFSVLLNTIEFMPENYTLQAIASDGYSLNYSMDEVDGHVTVYNETGDETGVGNLTMIIAYKENGKLLNETMGGPLRIAFVDEQGSITRSGMWLRSLVKIEII